MFRRASATWSVETQATGIRVTPTGRYLLRIVAGCFDRYRPQQQASAQEHFSRVM